MRVLVLVDVTNQYRSVQNSYPRRKIDYRRYLESAVGANELYRAFAYGVQIEEEASSFIQVLSSLGFEPRYFPAIWIDDRPDISRTDRNMTLAMDVWRTIDKVDTVVIGSSNADLVPLIQRIKELGRRVIVYSCCVSEELRLIADRVIEVNSSILESRLHEVAASA